MRAPRPTPILAPVESPLEVEPDEFGVAVLVGSRTFPELVVTGLFENGDGASVRVWPGLGCSSHPNCRTLRKLAKYFWFSNRE
jgi:hypothetical protein